MSRELTIRITIKMDEDNELVVSAVDVEEPTSGIGAGGAPAPPATDGGSIPGEVARAMEVAAPPRLVEFERRYLERAIKEFGVDPQLPESAKRRDEYVNLYPPARFGAHRASAFAFRSGRIEIYCRPEHAADFEHAEVVYINDVPTWVKLYLKSEEAVDQAIALTGIGLRER